MKMLVLLAIVRKSFVFFEIGNKSIELFQSSRSQFRLHLPPYQSDFTFFFTYFKNEVRYHPNCPIIRIISEITFFLKQQTLMHSKGGLLFNCPLRLYM